LPEREDVLECINDDTDEDHASLNSIPELVEDTDSDEEDNTVNQGTYTCTTWTICLPPFDLPMIMILDSISSSLISHATTAALEPRAWKMMRAKICPGTFLPLGKALWPMEEDLVE
jgi:hypothetical protein